MEFYAKIRSKYDNDTCSKLKKYSRNNISNTKHKNTLIFLLKCREFGLFPNFIKKSTANISYLFNFTNSKVDKGLQRKLFLHEQKFHNKLLNLAISHKYQQIEQYRQDIQDLKEQIINILTDNESSEFLNSQQNTQNKININTRNKQKSKLEKLKTSFKHKMGLCLQEKWFVNKTEVEFPDDMKWLLSMGHKFALPVKRDALPLFKIIADGEEMIKTKEVGDQDSARSNITQILQHHLRSTYVPNIDKFINKIHRDTKKFLQQHKDIYIVPADKGNVTVAMHKKEYIEKMRDIMADRSTYRVLRNNPTTKLQTANDGFVKDLFQQKLISEYQRKVMTTYTANSPKIYGLPKIHKEGLPLRPICASMSVPSYELSKFLVQILKNLVEGSKYNVKNSSSFIQALTPVELDKDDIMVSFDVVSLFTNVPIRTVLEIIDKSWNHLKNHTQIKKSMFMEMLRFCIIDNNYVEFGGHTYQQKQGVPMGSPASPILADIFMEHLLDEVLENLVCKPKILTKYVDDLFAVIRLEDLDTTLTALNSFHPRIQFTVEVEKCCELPYLDVKVVRRGNNTIFDWYRKPTSSGRLINFNSKQPRQIIMNTAQQFINRVLSTSDSVFHNKNKKMILDTLCSNSFPTAIIRTLISNYNKEKPTEVVANQEVIYRSALYIPYLSNRMKAAPIRDKEKTRIAYRSTITLKNELFTNIKGGIDKMERSDVVYRINCLGGNGIECPSVYIGTSKQKLKNRLSGHRSDIGSGSTQKTALALHCIEENHKPDLHNVTILQTERHQNKRMLLEMLHIVNTENAVNRRSDCEKLSSIYSQLFKRPRTFSVQ